MTTTEITTLLKSEGYWDTDKLEDACNILYYLENNLLIYPPTYQANFMTTNHPKFIPLLQSEGITSEDMDLQWWLCDEEESYEAEAEDDVIKWGEHIEDIKELIPKIIKARFSLPLKGKVIAYLNMIIKAYDS